MLVVISLVLITVICNIWCIQPACRVGVAIGDYHYVLDLGTLFFIGPNLSTELIRRYTH